LTTKEQIFQEAFNNRGIILFVVVPRKLNGSSLKDWLQAAAQRIPYRRPQERWKRGNLDTAELAFVGLAFGRHRPALEAVSNDFLFHLPCSQRIRIRNVHS